MERDQTVSSSAILLTPRPSAGGSAIAVVRIRGSGVSEFLRRFFSRPPSPGLCVHGELRDGQSVIDDCLVVLDHGGNWADICLHGGAWVIESTLKLAKREGFPIIDPALPVPAEAVDEATDELEREVLEYLPLALTEPAIRMLLHQPVAWRKKIDPAAMLKDTTLWRLLHPPKIAIVGEPNVGKSTLANRLFGQQRSITADLPGTTRDWVGEMADIGGLAATLIDTPGLRETDDPIEHSAIAASGEKIREADLLIVVLDATEPRPVSLPENSQRKIVLVNKIDRPAGWDFSAVDAIRISAKTGEGCEELCRAIRRRLGITDLDANRPRWWTQRQREILCSVSPPLRGGTTGPARPGSGRG
jgi:small GTP-binding protein